MCYNKFKVKASSHKCIQVKFKELRLNILTDEIVSHAFVLKLTSETIRR